MELLSLLRTALYGCINQSSCSAVQILSPSVCFGSTVLAGCVQASVRMCTRAPPKAQQRALRGLRGVSRSHSGAAEGDGAESWRF
jgi:hypothetical protein